jgi:anaerobic ribonucleoside-triphosphate reductase activating protein
VQKMNGTALRLHEFLSVSYVNGPGARAVIWVQGCALGCPGCFNPGTHSQDGGELIPVDHLVTRIAALGEAIEGISISGGEPLQQLGPVLALLRRVRQETKLSSLMFTGYTLPEIRQMETGETILGHMDVLIAGRYVASQRLGYGLRGSENQTIHLLSSRYSLEQVESVPPSEIIITAGGEILLSGIDAVHW